MSSNFYIIEQGDAFAVSDRVDHVITDPPYDAHCHENQRGGSAPGPVKVAFDPIERFSSLIPIAKCAKRWSLFFCTLESLGRIEAAAEGRFVRGAVWYKPNSMGQLTADRPAPAFEGIAILHDLEQKKRWNGRGSYAIWKCNGTRGVKNRHPNQKPLDLCRKLVALFTDPGDVILDPFCGSASIGVAAKELGRSYVGIDNDAEWVARAKSRIDSTPAESYDPEKALGLCSMKDNATTRRKR